MLSTPSARGGGAPAAGPLLLTVTLCPRRGAPAAAKAETFA